jgi:hypothetical protein
MNIYFNTLMAGDKLKALYLISDVGTFYAEPINDGVIGEGLLYNDYMFHFEGNPERTNIVLKDSEKYITDAIKAWLGNHTSPSFITNNNNSFDPLGSIAGINLEDYHTVVVGKDEEDMGIIPKTKKLMGVYGKEV